MRTTVTIDDDLLADAHEYSGIEDRPALIREALRALVAREAARRLVALGGTMPDLEMPVRKRYFEPDDPS